MNPYAGLNGLGAQNPAARLLQQPNAGGMPNGLTFQGSLPMDDMKAVWMQNQAGLVKAANAGVPSLGGMNLGAAAAAAQQQRMMQQPGAGLPGLGQVGNGAGGLGGMRMDNLAGMAGMGGHNQLQALQLQQLQAQAAQQQQAAQQAQAQMAIQQQMQRQQQMQQQQQLVQQQAQAQLALRQQQQQIQQQQQLQQQIQQQQLQQQLQQQQFPNAGLQGNAGLMQSNLQSLIGGAGAQGNQFLFNQGGNAAAAAQLANNQRQAELLAANELVSNQLQQLQNAGAQGLTAAQQQLLQQQLLKQAAQHGVSQGLQFGNVQQNALLQQQLQQANNAAQLRNLAQMNAQQDLVRRQQQAQAMQAQQQQAQQAQQAQLLQLQRQAQQQQQLQRQAQQQQQQLQAAQQAQQQSANQQAINAAAAMALRANAAGTASERDQQLLRLMAAAAGKADTVGTLPSQLSTANTTAALAQRQLVAGLNAQKAANLQGLAGSMQQGPSSSGAPNAALSQAMLSQLLQTNRPFEPDPARVGVIGQDRGKQPSTDLGAAGAGLAPGASAPMVSGTNSALSSLAGAVGLGLAPLAGNGSSAGPSRQMTPPPIGSPSTLAAAAAAAVAAGQAGESAAVAGAAGDAAGVAGGSGVVLLPETASPENVEKFLKAVGKRFAALGLTIEQAMEYNILTGLTKEQLAVLSAASSTPAAGAEGVAGAEGAAGASAAADIASGDAAGLLPAALAGVLGEGGAVSAPGEAGLDGDAAAAAAAAAADVPAVAAAAHEDDDDADKVLESLLEPEEKPAPVGQLDEATAAAILAMTGDANFNAFTYGFFGETGPADTMLPGGGIEDLLGELEPEGATTLDGDEAALGGLGGAAVFDLSELADFEPLDPAQLASWGSIDAGAGEGAALAAAALAAAGAHGAGAGEGAAAAAVPATVADVSGVAEGVVAGLEQPAGAEGEVACEGDAAAGQAPALGELAADLNGLSLGAGFE